METVSVSEIRDSLNLNESAVVLTKLDNNDFFSLMLIDKESFFRWNLSVENLSDLEIVVNLYNNDKQKGYYNSKTCTLSLFQDSIDYVLSIENEEWAITVAELKELTILLTNKEN